MIGLVGRKVGMTRVFTEDGVSYPVTVVEVLPNYVTQVKDTKKDGFNAIQVTTGQRKASRLLKSEAGIFAKAKVEAGRGFWEFRVEDNHTYEVGSALTLEMFSEGQRVDVTGISKGKGFAGCIKRHNFRGQDNSHGNSVSHRAPGSIGQNQSPGRVFKGKKMAGHLGVERNTIQSLKIVRVDTNRQVILIHGAVPGAPGADVIIRQAVKAKAEVAAA